MALDPLAERLCHLIPDWKGAEFRVTPLVGGITNTNFRVDVDRVPYVVRLESPSSAGLAIDRHSEWHNTAQAAALGMAPQVHYRFDEEQLSVREFLPGRTFSAAELRAPGHPARLGMLLRELHGQATFQGEFDLIRAAQGYCRRIESAGICTQRDYQARRAALANISATLGPRPTVLVACHNDLLAENILDDGQQWRLIDFEYSGQNDPCFELGNLCRELDFGPAEIDELCQAYFDSATDDQMARVRLNMLLSDVGWSLWAVLQEHTSNVDFDYAAYGTARWHRAAAVLDSADYPRLVASLR